MNPATTEPPQAEPPPAGPVHARDREVARTAATARSGPMRVLISGAGVAGLTLAALLARQGKMPLLIDRRPDDADLGYVIALWPQGTRVLHALGVHDAFAQRSEPMRRYRLQGVGGRVVGSWDAAELTARFDAVGCIERAALIELLEQAARGVELRRGVSVQALSQSANGVEVALDDGTREHFDAVIGADGLHSRVREVLYGRLPERDTGWACYAWWGDAALVERGDTAECWGAGSFLGFYPCREQVGIIVGGPTDVLQPEQPAGRTDRLRRLLAPLGVPLDRVFARAPHDDAPFYLWRMIDVRAPRWSDGRIALVGDAAAAFLPTAGIGASMALESAAALADELSRTDAAHLADALALYVKRRRRRVLAAQDQSRRLARLVFMRSTRLAALRDRALGLVSMRRMVGPIYKQLTTPI